MSKPRDYSSQSYSPSSKKPLRSVPTDRVDSSGKSKEKNDLVGLNDKFVALIEKVKNLENEKRRLETKLKILREQEDYNGKVEYLVKQLENELEQQIESLKSDQNKLQPELQEIQDEVDDTKKRYEDQLQKRGDLENDFIVSKKEVDEGHLEAVALAVDLEDLMRTMAFLRLAFDEEIKELESRIQNKTVVLQDNTRRSLDMDQFIKAVENQYATMATRTREEAEQWNQRKMESLVQTVGEREQEVRDIKREISDLLRLIQRLTADLESLRRKEEALMNDLDDARKEGEGNLNKARENIALLEDCLKRARQDLATLIRDHQELLNIKLAMDIEINTYRKLLEGEEQRMSYLMHQSDVHLPPTRYVPANPKATEPTPVRDIAATTPTIAPDTTIVPPVSPATKKRLLIRLEVEEGKLVSESYQYTD
ncbi:keratin, type II cytoskeletal 8 isoform X1 [Haplochromis burtoni]|uniref:keratin, type II cytoskeletal 8 isoform X1 n=1 Tax=Haplochromis burtoni TaxID=8153 RepID=UPI0003BD152B|nr:keratin, type II cytoskeletal 8 isoform X1 [Haplochromis burtoni]